MKYSGKELDEEGGLSKYHFGWREYDAELGRWNRVDPLSGEYPGWSPYNYVKNSPVNLVDPNGLKSEGWIDPFYILWNRHLANQKANWSMISGLPGAGSEYWPGRDPGLGFAMQDAMAGTESAPDLASTHGSSRIDVSGHWDMGSDETTMTVGETGEGKGFIITADRPEWIIDRYEIRVYSSDAWGFGLGLNHAFIYSTKTGEKKGTAGMSGSFPSGNPDGGGPLDSPYKVVNLPPGISPEQFMQKILEYPGWNGFYFPGVYDCHSQLENAFEYAGVPYPGAPNGRFDFDDNFRSGFSDFIRNINNPNYLMNKFFIGR